MRWTCEQLRALYNGALEERREAYRKQKVFLSGYSQMSEIKAVREVCPEYATMHVHLLQDAISRLDKAYRAFFRRVRAGEKPGFPRFKGRGRYSTFTFKDAKSHRGVQLCTGGKRLDLAGVGKVRSNYTGHLKDSSSRFRLRLQVMDIGTPYSAAMRCPIRFCLLRTSQSESMLELGHSQRYQTAIPSRILGSSRRRRRNFGEHSAGYRAVSAVPHDDEKRFCCSAPNTTRFDVSACNFIMMQRVNSSRSTTPSKLKISTSKALREAISLNRFWMPHGVDSSTYLQARQNAPVASLYESTHAGRLRNAADAGQLSRRSWVFAPIPVRNVASLLIATSTPQSTSRIGRGTAVGEA